MEIYRSSSQRKLAEADPLARDRPFDDVKETDIVLKLAGITPYEDIANQKGN